ncbi:MAG: MoaD/ThiS family protein [Rhodospirillales bacterium]|nr:MoaD/ThiS family protein [Rhodospirillales bacterium]MDP7242232.1 MoaD/ThiS family protein [Rhodospirillales bacterium]HJO72046.1 MoaD/ThiS family protein [Rhodospirillales bacterium]
MRVEVRFYANLSRYATGGIKDEAVTLETATGSTVIDVLCQLGLPDDVETTVLIEGRHAQPSSVVGDGDHLDVFPLMSGG